MQATKLKPLDLRKPKIKLHLPTTTYSHVLQRREIGVGIILMATTWNGTQTFDSHGKPYDKDNDK